MDNEILKNSLLHYINLEYYANGLDEEFQTLLNELTKRCYEIIDTHETINTKNSYNVIYKAIKEEVDKYKKELEERLDEEAEVILNQELEFLDKTYNNSSDKKESSLTKATNLAIGGASLAKLLFAPIDGRDTVSQFAERTGKNLLQSFDTSLRSGYLFGQKTEAIKSQISNKLKQVARGIQSGVRTAIPAFAKNTDKAVFAFNNLEVVWVATLDGRTCISCAVNSGLHFKSIALAPFIPLHCLCRCILMPVNRITEPIPEYEEFIESLSDKEQQQVLGKNRYELYKNGLSLQKFVNNGSVVKLEDIKVPENIYNKMLNEKNCGIS